MKMKKSLLLVIPAAALALGGVTLAALSGQGNTVVGVHAAEYTRAERSLSENEGSITATFDVSDNDLNMKGWLLCLFESKPTFDPVSRKLVNSDKLHPHSLADCSHYFFAAGTAKTGTMNVTWAANAADQKEAWSAGETTGEAGKTLKDYLEADDWYLVIGPRHTASWRAEDIEDKIGAGQDGYWENADYYVGLESNVLGGLSGETYLDLSEFPSWKDADAKFGFYYWDDSSNNAFSEFAAPVSGLTDIYLASYEFEFTPTHMMAVRFNKTATAPNWDDKWTQTQDFDTFHECGVIGVTGWDGADSWVDGLAEVNIADAANPIVLDHYKRNGAGHSEHFGESVTLAAGDKFVIDHGASSYTAFTTHDSLEGVFSIKDEKITVSEAGTYSFYFDATANSLYITSPDIAAADEWAQAFLNGGCESTLSNWDDLGDMFDDLSVKSKNLLLDVEHEPDPTKILEGYVAQAVQRYDYVITIYGTDTYEDFMGRIDAGKLTAKSALPMNSKDGTLAITVAVLGGVALASFAGLFIFSKKRKSQAN